ncbi:Hypothetical protein NTJ_00350 [Nesidiocoris tenuis]|uniref:Uncharacterized protein n=1 Tax=Nesidiocoris tenuis TaxID=355587 RepID=A0ABN7A646_9HEMI|nr:Hypothetical protein NTJ_00350 [Nesidiocoris tenuis]
MTTYITSVQKPGCISEVPTDRPNPEGKVRAVRNAECAPKLRSARKREEATGEPASATRREKPPSCSQVTIRRDRLTALGTSSRQLQSAALHLIRPHIPSP